MKTYEFDDLATYNAERARGIVHTPEWQEKMKHRQSIFDWQQRNAAGIETGPPPPPIYLPPATEERGIPALPLPWFTATVTFLVGGAVGLFVHNVMGWL